MGVPFESFVNSAPFQFVVGPAALSFYMHSELVKHHSKTLGVLISGGMTEAQQGVAFLKDIEENTFLCFVQFAYTGDYKDPQPDPASEEDFTPAKATSFEFAAKKKSKKGQVATGWNFSPPETSAPEDSDLWTEFQVKANAQSSKPLNTDPSEEYTSVFQCHASVYVFADRYDIAELGDLAISKLRRILARFTLYPERAEDVIELVRYAYDHTVDRDKQIDELRHLILDYVVCHVERLVEVSGFSNLLHEKGDFAKDLVPKMAQRLAGQETSGSRAGWRY